MWAVVDLKLGIRGKAEKGGLLTAMVYRQGRTQGEGVGVNPPLEHNILQNFITYAKEINCFRILFAC